MGANDDFFVSRYIGKCIRSKAQSAVLLLMGVRAKVIQVRETKEDMASDSK